MSRYKRPDKDFQECVAALAEKPRRKLEPRVHRRLLVGTGRFELPTPRTPSGSED